MKAQDVIKGLKKIVGADWVRTDELSRFHNGADVLTHFGQGAMYPENHPLAVVMPGSTKDVQSVVRFAGKNNVPSTASEAAPCS